MPVVQEEQQATSTAQDTQISYQKMQEFCDAFTHKFNQSQLSVLRKVSLLDENKILLI